MRRKARHEQMVQFLRAFVASVDYHDQHDAAGLAQTMRDARDTARALLHDIDDGERP